MSEFKMPSLGADMEKGVLVEWNFKEGDHVKKGDIIALVETDKGLIDIEVFHEGIIREIKVPPGEEVPVGEVLAIIDGGKEKEKVKEKGKPEEKKFEKAASEKIAGKKKTEPQSVKPEKGVKISPRARKLATELGVDLSKVQGTGPGGTIEGDDIERAAKGKGESKEKAPSEVNGRVTETSESAKRMRQAIAAAMSRSNREIPHYYLERTIDMTNAMKWLDEQNKKRTVKERFLPAVILIKATAMALRATPQLNGSWVDDSLQISDDINIGLSVSLRQGGLVNTAVKNADSLSLDEIREAMNDLITRARSGRLKSSELTDSTITLTYLGDKGAEIVYGVIYPPQVALVGFGRIIERPTAHEGMIGIRPAVRATLAADHRATDGVIGSRFLEALDGYLQEADKL